VTWTELAAHHRLCAFVDAPQERAEHRADDECEQASPQACATNRRHERSLGRGGKASRFAGLLPVALNDGDRIDHLGRDRARICDSVLAVSTEPAHLPPDQHRRHHDDQQCDEHLQHHVRVRHDQHDDRPERDHTAAQPHAEARPRGGLDQRGVRDQARDHLTGLRSLEELWTLPHQVGVDRVAQICGDALADPGDHVDAARREHAQRNADREQREEVIAHGHHTLRRIGCDEPAIDQRAQRPRKRERACSR
jgi:hypothetical protein